MTNGSVRVSVFGKTDLGRTREHNEDTFLVADLSTGNAGGDRTDTIMLLRLDPRSEEVTLLSFPRDLWVPIAGSEVTHEHGVRDLHCESHDD